MFTKIQTEKQYQAAIKTVESLLEKATNEGGFHHLSIEEGKMLAELSKLIEVYEDNVLELMPIKPTSLKQAIELKMVELGLSQAGLAELLGIGAPKLSQILNGKRQPDVNFLKAVYRTLKIDAEFLLEHG